MRVMKAQVGAGLTIFLHIERFREIFSSLDIQKGFIVSLTDQTAPLRADLTAITFDDYILQVTKAVSG